MDGLRFVNVRPNFAGDNSRFPRPRPVTSCLQCRRRKVRCDHAVPQCSACRRGNHPCSYATSASARTSATPREAQWSASGRDQQDSPTSDILARLQRLEALIERAADGPQSSHVNGTAANFPLGQSTSAYEPVQQESQNSSGKNNAPGLSSDGLDGTLLLEDGQSHYVSSVHWALLADEIHDIRSLLKDHAGDEIEASGNAAEISRKEEMSNNDCHTSLLFGNTMRFVNLTAVLPKNPEDCYALLTVFFSNVDPMTRIVHKPSLSLRFQRYIEFSYQEPFQGGDGVSARSSSQPDYFHTFEPLVFAIMYSAVNSMRADTISERFGMDKTAMLGRFRRGAELSLDREDVMTTSSLEVLQGFVLLLSSQFREDDLGKSWPLTGVAIRIAIDQGLHREPSLFPSGNMDSIQAEIRRRVWHQLCHLDFRSAEGKGHEPTISDDDFTTLLPQNVNDEELSEDAPPSAVDQSKPGFTDMTTHLIRLNGIHCFRKVVQSTYRLERRIKTSTLGDGAHVDPVVEIQHLYREVQTMVDAMLEKQRSLYLCHCDPNIPLHGVTLGLAALLEWKCWVIFWLRLPIAYREVVMSAEVRTMIFEKSVKLMENLITANLAKEAEPFQWHINGHSAFQAIMHVLSELKTPEFSATNHVDLRNRAFCALQKMRKLKEGEQSKTWKVVRRMIDRTIPPNWNSSDICPPAMSARAEGNRDFGNLSQELSSDSHNQAPGEYSHENYAGDSYQPSLRGGLASWANTGGEATLVEAPDLSELSGEFDWGWWNLDSLPWSPSG